MSVNITTIDPTNGSNNVSLNKIISVIFTITGGPTGLNTDTLIPANFALKHTKSGQVIRCAVTYDTAVLSGGDYTQKVYVTPNTLLFKNSSYTFKIIGQDAQNSFPTGYIKDNSDNALSGITIVTFVTGDDIEVSDNDKTNSQQNYEGDIRLPSSLKLTQSARLQLVNSVPQDHSWGFTGNTITLTFNRNVDTGSAMNAITLSQYPFLDEQGWYARTMVVGAGIVFQWDSATWANEAAGFFDEPSWTTSVSGKTVTLSGSSYHLYNTRYELDISTDLTDTNGNHVLNPGKLIFTSDSYPSYITPNAIRNEIYSIFDNLNLDFVHELVWKHSIELYRSINFQYNFSSRGQYIRDFVKYSTVLDIIYDQLIPGMLLAGTSKQLGDFKISYSANAGTYAGDTIYSRIQKKLDKARKALVYSHLPVIAIKGLASSTDMPNFRYRLWSNPNTKYQGLLPYPSPNRGSSANTASERQYKLPGYYDDWN